MTKRDLLVLLGITVFFLGFLCPWIEGGQLFWGEAMVISGNTGPNYLAGYNITLGWFMVLVLILAISIDRDFIKRRFKLQDPVIYRVQLFLGILALLLFLVFFYDLSMVGYGLFISMAGGAVIFYNCFQNRVG